MQLDYITVMERLKGLDPYIHLTIYILNIQGMRRKKLDYNAAAKALGVDRRSIGRYLAILAERQVLTFEDGTIKLSDEIFKQG